MSNIAFIGLGTMGSPMAVHLADAEHSVTGYNRTPDKTKPLVEAGGHAAESVADAVRDAEVVCVMVPDSPDVVDVLTGEDGVFAHASAGARQTPPGRALAAGGGGAGWCARSGRG